MIPDKVIHFDADIVILAVSKRWSLYGMLDPLKVSTRNIFLVLLMTGSYMYVLVGLLYSIMM